MHIFLRSNQRPWTLDWFRRRWNFTHGKFRVVCYTYYGSPIIITDIRAHPHVVREIQDCRNSELSASKPLLTNKLKFGWISTFKLSLPNSDINHSLGKTTMQFILSRSEHTSQNCSPVFRERLVGQVDVVHSTCLVTAVVSQISCRISLSTTIAFVLMYSGLGCYLTAPFV